MRIVLDQEGCREGCDSVDFESLQLGKMTLKVRNAPDLVLEARELISFVPMRLSGLSADHPEALVWSAAIKLAPEAARRVEELGQRLGPQVQILISANGKPLEVTYAHLIGQMMNLGEFSSRSELIGSLGAYAPVEEGTAGTVEIFTPEELAAQRVREKQLEASDQYFKETERIRKARDEGRISDEDMLKQLRGLRSAD